MGKPVAPRAGRAAGAEVPVIAVEETGRPVRPRDARGCFLPSGARIVAEGGTGRAGKSVRAKARPVRWSPRRQAAFLAALAETANIAGSARAAKVSETTVRRKRRDCADFRAQWERALGEGVATLKMQLLDRALNGVRETVWHGGKKVGTVVKFNDRIALALIAAHGAKEPSVESAPPVPVEELRERLKAKLSEMNRRMGGAG